MSLEEILIQKLEDLGAVTFKRMFGWQCFLTDGKLIDGYKAIDESIINLMLLLDVQSYKQAIDGGLFEKFEFGKTWVEATIESEEELTQIWPTLKQSYGFVRSKSSKK